MTQKINPLLLDIPDELRGERVLLRPLRDDDAYALWNAVEASRDHLARWMPWVKDHNSQDFSREYIRKMQAKWIMREDFPMGIFRIADNLLLGASGLHRIDWSVPAMEAGYWLRPDAEGHGYIGEAVQLLMGFAFNHLHAERLEIRCDSKNLRSAAVPQRLGFVHEATLRCSRRNTDNTLGDGHVF
ncbi:MAG: GNAT family N-acetyltransferase, partial [Betaproteobacteria bacterium]